MSQHIQYYPKLVAAFVRGKLHDHPVRETHPALFTTALKEHHLLAGLPKTHANDAAVIATRGKTPQFRTTQVILKKCIPAGDYQQTKGVRSEQPITTGKIRGFRKFDKVWYGGREYFIKGRMSTGHAILMGIDGKKVDLKPIPKFEKMKRVSARSSWILSQRIMPSFLSSTT